MPRRVTVHIAHAQFLPERAATLERLLGQLRDQQGCARVPDPVVHRSTKREHSSTWAVRVYNAIAAENPDAAVVLNDDVQVSPHLVAAIEAMLEVPTSRMLSLHAVHPMGRSLAEAGLRWFTTWHLTGPAYVFRGHGGRGAGQTAKELLAYYSQAPKAWVGRVNEDDVAIHWAFRLNEPIWNAVPSLCQHDASIPSSLGYDQHPQRVSNVPWTDPLFDGLDVTEGWDVREPPPFLETHWTQTATLVTDDIAIRMGIDTMQCWWCLERPAAFGSQKSGARMCGRCLHDCLGGVINTAMGAQGRPPT